MARYKLIDWLIDWLTCKMLSQEMQSHPHSIFATVICDVKVSTFAINDYTVLHYWKLFCCTVFQRTFTLKSQQVKYCIIVTRKCKMLLASLTSMLSSHYRVKLPYGQTYCTCGTSHETFPITVAFPCAVNPFLCYCGCYSSHTCGKLR